ncbi:MAG: winged helix-turn-helix transcriptional regulator [Myxococcales bacterium]|nr:winged helix-turn-helix transcriptional regulator [Myxococcales bacterium]
MVGGHRSRLSRRERFCNSVAPGSTLTKHTPLCIYAVVHLDVFQALADPTRRRIVEALRRGELQVGDVVEKAGIHQSGVSRHLRILLESGFVSMRPDGQRRLYALRPEPFRDLESWLSQYRALWDARLDRFGAALEKRQEARRATKKGRETS